MTKEQSKVNRKSEKGSNTMKDDRGKILMALQIERERKGEKQQKGMTGTQEGRRR